MRVNKKRKRLISNQGSVHGRPGPVEIVAIMRPWEIPGYEWRFLSSPIPILIRSQIGQSPEYCMDGQPLQVQAFIYGRYIRSNGGQPLDFQWVIGKDNTMIKTGVCLTLERAKRNADRYLKKLKCLALNHKFDAFA